ncbi:probable methyltransferase-like protein 25 isoform X2 [Macrobrachium rosenbergii]|uniref:probable methyltransferase-like protein 25 isoform X2 n=1 Tax=Macrobrachium rosenbergii TaxID=79674 RepID=UPI0034D4838B
MEGQSLEKIVQFLKEVEWLYDFPVTQVHWPSSLKEFLKQCKELSLQQWISTNQHGYIARKLPQELTLPKELCKGMSPKKKHEVTAMVQYVKELCDLTNSSRILDIGSGMGYVDSALHHALGVTVVGAESEDCRVRDALDRQTMLTGTCEGIRHMKWLLKDDQATLDKALEIVQDLANYKALCTCSLNSERTQNITFKQDVDTTDICTDEREIYSPEEELQELSKQSSIVSESAMLIGLHSCADLSSVMIKIFKYCPKISSVVLFSCCYHKLDNNKVAKISSEKENVSCDKFKKPEEVPALDNTQVCVDSVEESIESSFSNGANTKEINERDLLSTVSYKNFPMSNNLKQIMEDNKFHLSIYGLRLAAQESGVRWLRHTEKDHEIHERNVVYRALLEVFCQKEGITLKKCRRRCARKSKFLSFTEYITTVLENYEFIPIKGQSSYGKAEHFIAEESFSKTKKASERDSCLSSSGNSSVSVTLQETPPMSREFIRDGLEACFTEYKGMFYLTEPLTGLQLALQPVLEALVLLDRVTYLKEAKFEKVWLEEVFDVALSPRNVALIAVR